MLERDKELREDEERGVGKAKALQVAPSPPKRAGNSCHSLWDVQLPGARPSTPSIPVSQRHVNDKTLITPLINGMIYFSSVCLMFVKPPRVQLLMQQYNLADRRHAEKKDGEKQVNEMAS